MMLSCEVPGRSWVSSLTKKVRRLGAVCEAEEREREEDEGDERQEREVRDHRREVGAAVGEELVHELAATDPHG